MWTIFPKTSLTPQSLGIYLVHYLVHFTARYETVGCKFQIAFWRLYQTAFCSLTKNQLIVFFISKNWNWQSLECRMEKKKVIHDKLNFFLKVIKMIFIFVQRLWWKMESLWVMESLSTNHGKRQKSRSDIWTVTKFLMYPWGSPIVSQGSRPLPSVLGWWVNL